MEVLNEMVLLSTHRELSNLNYFDDWGGGGGGGAIMTFKGVTPLQSNLSVVVMVVG